MLATWHRHRSVLMTNTLGSDSDMPRRPRAHRGGKEGGMHRPICLGVPRHIDDWRKTNGAASANIGRVGSRELFPRSANATSLMSEGLSDGMSDVLISRSIFQTGEWDVFSFICEKKKWMRRMSDSAIRKILLQYLKFFVRQNVSFENRYPRTLNPLINQTINRHKKVCCTWHFLTICLVQK
jgi:hypothetical protein